MEQMLTGAEKIGDIVSSFPGASNLFKQNCIDFCCGGNRTLSSALRERNIEEEPFLTQLNQLYKEATAEKNSETDWREAPTSQLIEHIVNVHHGYLQKELPLLSEFVGKILRVHGTAHQELAQLHRLFNEIRIELEQHLVLEEEVVFPLLQAYAKSPSQGSLAKAVQAIDELETDHEVVGNILKQMRAVTNDYQLPVGACTTYTLTFKKLEELESDMFQHVHLENNILFPRVSSVGKA